MAKNSKLLLLLAAAAAVILAVPAKAVWIPKAAHDMSAAYQSWKTVSSLVHSLLSRVATLRKSRGDYQGAQRVEKIADGLHDTNKWWRTVGSMGWDYIIHYAWKDLFVNPSEYVSLVRELNQMLYSLDELMQIQPETKKLEWISKNYKRVLKLSKSLLQRLLVIFSKKGPLRESILIMHKEISDGDLFRDCLELGVADVQGIIHVIRDTISTYFAPKSTREGSAYSEL